MMLANKGGVLVLTAASSAMTARALGPSGRGILAVSLGLTLILVQFGHLGISSANTYFAAREPGEVSAMVTNAIWLSLGVGVALMGAGYLVRIGIPALLRGVNGTELTLAMLAIPISMGMSFMQGLVLGQARTVAYNVVELSANVGYVLLLAVGLFALHFGVAGTLALSISRSLAGYLSYLFVLHSGARPARRPDVALLRRMLRYGTRVYLANLIAFLVIRADLLLVNAYRGDRQAGLYSVTVAIADALYVVPTAFAVNLFPRVARGGTAERTAEVFRRLAILFAGLCVIAVVLARPAISIVYGHRFTEAATLFYWLVPGTFCLGMLNVLAHHFAGRGYPLGAVLVWFGGLAVNLTLNLVFLPSSGTFIAALSSSVAYALLLALHAWMFAREVGTARELIPRPSDLTSLVRAVLPRIRFSTAA